MFEQSAMREKNHWFVLGVSLFIVTLTLLLTVLWSSNSQAFKNGDSFNLLFKSDEYQSPEHCRECHTAEFEAWSDTSHAQASFDPLFQTFVQLEKEPNQCFSCHTTGYNQATGQFVLAGVTCEACHGPCQKDHPEQHMTIAPPVELCGACHTSTAAEWASSHHGRVGVTCTDCHEVHAQKTLAPKHTNALCANCHQNMPRVSVHVTHDQTGILCIDCHLAHPDINAESAMEGKASTGHAFAVLVSTCDDCHP